MMQRLGQALKGALLLDFVGAFGLGMKHMLAPKKTVQYPHERNPQSPRFRGEHALRREPSERGSDSMVMAWAGQMASHSLQAMQRSSPFG